MKDCVYDLTINDTWIMQSLYHSNKKFGERKSHIEKLFFSWNESSSVSFLQVFLQKNVLQTI